MAIHLPTPGFKGRMFKLCVLTRQDFNFCIHSSPLQGFWTGELASCLPHTLASSFMHMTCQVGQTTFCPEFESKLWAKFLAELMTFGQCLWKAHWFLWNSFDLIYENTQVNKSTCIQMANKKREKLSLYSPHYVQILVSKFGDNAIRMNPFRTQSFWVSHFPWPQ